MKKRFQELVLRIETLQEDQQGRLKGGFSALGSVTESELYQTDTCTNNCPCTNKVSNCGSSTNGAPACS